MQHVLIRYSASAVDDRSNPTTLALFNGIGYERELQELKRYSVNR